MNRVRRHQRHAGVERRLPQALLHDRFRRRELRLGVDAAHFVLRDFQRDRPQLHAARDRHRIGQIEFALAIVTADPFEDRQRRLAGERHQPAVAERDRRAPYRSHRRAPHANQRIALRHQPAVTGRIGGPETRAPRRRRRPRSRRAASPASAAGSAACRRRSPEYRRRRARLRPGPPEPHARCRAVPPARRSRASASSARASAATAVVIGPDHDGGLRPAGRPQRRQHMPQQRPARHRVQHLRPRRQHARAFAGRQHDRQAGSRAHHSSARLAAVITEWP